MYKQNGVYLSKRFVDNAYKIDLPQRVRAHTTYALVVSTLTVIVRPSLMINILYEMKIVQREFVITNKINERSCGRFESPSTHLSISRGAEATTLHLHAASGLDPPILLNL